MQKKPGRRSNTLKTPKKKSMFTHITKNYLTLKFTCFSKFSSPSVYTKVKLLFHLPKKSVTCVFEGQITLFLSQIKPTKKPCLLSLELSTSWMVIVDIDSPCTMPPLPSLLPPLSGHKGGGNVHLSCIGTVHLIKPTFAKKTTQQRSRESSPPLGPSRPRSGAKRA